MDEPHSLFQKIKARWTKIKMSLICSSRSAGARGPVWKINKLSLVNSWFIEIESYVRFEKPPIKKHCWPTIIPPFWISLPNHIINTMTIVIFLDTRFALPYNTRDANKKLAVALLCFALIWFEVRVCKTCMGYCLHARWTFNNYGYLPKQQNKKHQQ